MSTRLILLLPLLVGVAACSSSARFGGGGSPQLSATAPAPAVAAPTDPVASEPLAPLGADGDPLVVTSEVTPSPGTDPSVIDPTGADPVAVDPVPSAAPSARSLAGAWKISDAGRGSSCTIQLTQSTLLDLYRARPNGCQASSLAKVNAWQLRGQEVVLIEPGGRTAVRLFPKGDGSYEGAATTSGAVVTMVR